MYRWDLYYRYRRDYESGGPWVYVRNYIVSPTRLEEVVLWEILDQLSHGVSEVISLRYLYEIQGVHFEPSSIVTAKEAKEARS